ncbi:Zinc finger, CCCH-type, partial [Sesbania bispinosa]
GLLKCGGTPMEPSESESIGSSIKDPQLGSQGETFPHHDHDPQASDLNNHALVDDALGGELQNKLDLKDGDETENEVSNFEADDEQLCGEAAAPEPDKGQSGMAGFEELAVKENEGERDELEEKLGQTECKYYLRSGGCKFGKACKFNHTRGKYSSSTAPASELNFLGLPIRLGEKECPYYMRTGSCKFGANCKFNHPDPTAVGVCDSPSGYGNGSSIPLQGVSQSSIPSWSSTRTLNETAPFMPMILSPTLGVSPQSSEWNGYQ